MSLLIDTINLDGTEGEELVEFDVTAFDYCTVTSILRSGTWGAAVLTLEVVGTDGVWEDVGPSAKGIFDEQIHHNVEVTGKTALRARLTTTQAGAAVAVLKVWRDTAESNTQHRELQLNDLGAAASVDVNQFTTVRVEPRSELWTTAEVKVIGSEDGTQGKNLTTLTSSGPVPSAIDVTGYRALVLSVDVVEGSDSIATFAVYREGAPDGALAAVT